MNQHANESVMAAVRQRLNELNQTYSQQGYRVAIKPAREDLPFDMPGYMPDLIAFRDGGGVLVDVKSSAARLSIDRLHTLAQDIAEHAGWRFALVTLQDEDVGDIPTSADELLIWTTIVAKQGLVAQLLSAHEPEAALLVLCSILEAALRRRAFEQRLPIDRLPAPALTDYMYSQGEISHEQLTHAHAVMSSRNRIAHGAVPQLELARLKYSLDMFSDLLANWSREAYTGADPWIGYQTADFGTAV